MPCEIAQVHHRWLGRLLLTLLTLSAISIENRFAINELLLRSFISFTVCYGLIHESCYPKTSLTVNTLYARE